MRLHCPSRAGHEQRGQDEWNPRALYRRAHPVPRTESPQPPVQAGRQQRIDQDLGKQHGRGPDDEQGRQRDAQREQDHGERNCAFLGMSDGRERFFDDSAETVFLRSDIEIGAGATAVEAAM